MTLNEFIARWLAPPGCSVQDVKPASPPIMAPPPARPRIVFKEQPAATPRRRQIDIKRDAARLAGVVLILALLAAGMERLFLYAPEYLAQRAAYAHALAQ